MKRFFAIAALVLVVGAAVGALTFPTDALVQWVLDRVPLPDGLQLQFASAHLRPSGLRLDDVHMLRAGGGRRAFDAEWLRLRPSLWGVWNDRTGRPWTIAAGLCQGTIEVTIGTKPRATPIAVALEQVELAACLPYVLPQVDAFGRIDGKFDVDVGIDIDHASTGAIELRGASWKPGGPLGDTPLRVDAGAIDWRLENGRLEITKLDATGKDFQATGSGLLRVVQPIDDSVLDLRIAVTPGATMPPLLRRYFDAIAGAAPDQHGTRTFRVQGQLRDPRLIAAGTLAPHP